MDLPQSVKDVLSNVQTMLERKSTRVDEMGVRRRALAGDTEAKAQVRLWDSEDRARPFPRVMPDGSDVKTLEDVAALMGTTTAVAAHYVGEQKGLPVDLYRAATKALYRGEQDEHNSSGIMIALVFEPEAARAIAARGAMKEDEIHLTLGYYGSIAPSDAPEEDFLLGHLKRMGQNFSPFTINLNGITRFSSEDGPDAVVVNADAPELEELRSYLRTETTIKSEHGFTPHVTIGYVDADGAVPVKRFKPIRVRAEKIMLAYGDRQHIVPLSKPDIRGEKAMEFKASSNLVNHATRELAIVGMTVDSEDEMNAALARAVLGIVEKFASQGHSGMSAGYALGTLERLLAFKPLTPLTDNPDEWIEVAEGLWQSVRDSEAFSKDGGKTYTLNSERSRKRISKPHGEKADFSVEIKGLIRRVRTAAGARRFRQPIGAIIVPKPNATGSLPSKPDSDTDSGKPTPKKPEGAPLASRGSSNRMSAGQIKDAFSLGGNPPTGEDILGESASDTLARFNKVDADKGTPTWENFTEPDDDFREWEYTTPDGSTRALVRNQNDSTKFSIRIYDAELQDALPDGFALRPFHTESQSIIGGRFEGAVEHVLRQRVAEAVKKQRYFQALNRKDPVIVRTDRVSTSLRDVYEGTYGRDYFYEDDDRTRPFNLSERKAHASEKREELGIKVLVKRRGESPSLEVEELINEVAESMEKIIPGYTDVMNTYVSGIDGSPLDGIILASNSMRWSYDPFDGGSKRGVQINLNADFYGRESANRPDPAKRMYAQQADSTNSGWFSTEDVRVLAEDWGNMDPAYISQMATLVHEHGHTLARALYGEEAMPAMMGVSQEDQIEISRQFRSSVNEILFRYGITDERDFLEQYDVVMSMTGGAGHVKANSEYTHRRLIQAISRYGATNFHEVMAETWASYMLDERPTQFVQELGDTMRDLSIEWFSKRTVK